jgi:GT2 family glycosyltransferase
MSRPPISAVMPFAGDRTAADAALAALLELDIQPGDELMLVDNSGTVAPDARVMVLSAPGERSPAHARNVGAMHARNDWILFIDADCRPESRLLDAYFAQPPANDVGALAGEVLAMTDNQTFVGRYGAARGFLSQEVHLAHPYLPRAVAANLLVRRAAFEQLGGFYEGVRAAEDTDFSWRLQRAGWRLELCPEAQVRHLYRTTLRELRRQWRGYAAGRAWLSRRYDGFQPQPALERAAGRFLRRLRGAPGPRRVAPARNAGRLERAGFLALDALLSADELAGFALSNRPSAHADSSAEVVLVAERFPERDDPLVEFARTLERARVEAVMRPERPDLEMARNLQIDYREDEGAATRAFASAAFALRHPLRCVRDVMGRAPGEPALAEMAPAVRRLQRDAAARVHALGGSDARASASRIARLAGRPLEGDRR